MKITEVNCQTGVVTERDMTPEEVAAAEAQYAAWLAAQPACPAAVTPRQARLALHAAGLLASVEAAIAQAGGAVAIEWEYATTIDRASPLVASMAQSLGLTEPQLDALFTQAAAL